MAIAPLPPVVGEIQQYTGQPGRAIPKPPPSADSLLALQAEPQAPAAVSILPTATALDQAVSEALGRQDGMAPLFATLADVADAPDLPPALRTAIGAVLDFRLGGEAAPSAESLKQSVRLSGLFHESQPAAPDLKVALATLRREAIAWSGTSVAAPAFAAAPGADFRPLGQRLADEIDRVLARPFVADALSEGGSEPTLQGLLARVAKSSAAPEPIRTVVAQLLTPGAAASASDVPAALGLLRRMLTTGLAPSGASSDSASTEAQVVARPTQFGQRLVDEIDRVLARPESLLGTGDPASRSPLVPLLGKVATIAGLPDGLKQAIDVMLRLAAAPPSSPEVATSALTQLRREVVAWAATNADSLAVAAPSGAPLRPMPPRKGAPLRGQGAIPPDTNPPDMRTLVARLADESDRALSRLFLHQALLADGQGGDKPAPAGQQPQQSFLFELPIAGPSGTSVAQFRFEREGRRPDADQDEAGPAYRAEIAFDIAPLGPMTVRVGLLPGKRVAVGLWCERGEEIHRLEAERDGLIATLEAEGFTVSGIDLHRGRPTERSEPAALSPRHRLDVQL